MLMLLALLALLLELLCLTSELLLKFAPRRTFPAETLPPITRALCLIPRAGPVRNNKPDPRARAKRLRHKEHELGRIFDDGVLGNGPRVGTPVTRSERCTGRYRPLSPFVSSVVQSDFDSRFGWVYGVVYHLRWCCCPSPPKVPSIDPTSLKRLMGSVFLKPTNTTAPYSQQSQASPQQKLTHI